MFVNIFLEMYQQKSIWDGIMLPFKLIAKPVAVIANEVQKTLAED